MTGTFDPRLLTLSVLIAVLAAFVALNLVQRESASRGWAATAWLTGGALLLGAGLWSTGLISLLAFGLPIPLVYHLPTMLFALGIAVVISGFALWIASGPRIGGWRIVLAALCLALGLAGMLYSGLFAMQIVPAVYYDAGRVGVSLGCALLASILLLWLAQLLRHGRSTPTLLARGGAGALIGGALAAMHYTGITAARFAPDSYSLGAAAGRVADPGNGVLVMIALVAVLGLLVLLALTIIDHAHEQGGKTGEDGAFVPASRALLERRFTELRELAQPAGRMLALLTVGLAQFRAVSGVPGGAPEDPLLREVAQRLAALVRPGDLVAQLEDGDFVLLLAQLGDAAQAERVALRVREEVGSIRLPHVEVEVSPAVGIGLYPRDGADLDTLLRLARAAQPAS